MDHHFHRARVEEAPIEIASTGPARAVPTECTDVAQFLRAPIGRFVAGEAWIYFYPSVELCGAVLSGRLTEDAMQSFVRVLSVGLDQAPHAFFIDARRLESVDPIAFELFCRYMRDSRVKASRSIKRLAVVRGATLGGAVATGLLSVAPPSYPFEVFDDPADALAWLRVLDARGQLEAIDVLTTRQTASRPLRGLRTHLRSHVADATLASCARALHLSERTLQRILHGERTSFKEELTRARIQRAEELLLETDTNLAHIAADVGCGSIPSFIVCFRRLTGETPASWRSARKRRQRGVL